MKTTLNEGLREKDLQHLVKHVFEVDTYKSKMGDDADVAVLRFEVDYRNPAKDLMEFIEKGYPFVLDSDISSGEDENGKYSVFVEIQRTNKLHEHIEELLYGVKRLTGIDSFKFSYYNRKQLFDCSTDILKNKIPRSVSEYKQFRHQLKENSVKQFFNRTVMDKLELHEDKVIIYKPFGNRIELKLIEDNEVTESILESSKNNIDFSESATAEIFWLTKVLGDYNISKINDTFVFENGNKAMIFELIK